MVYILFMGEIITGSKFSDGHNQWTVKAVFQLNGQTTYKLTTVRRGRYEETECGLFGLRCLTRVA